MGKVSSMVAAKKGAESFFLALEVLAPATAKPAAHAPALGSVAVLAPARLEWRAEAQEVYWLLKGKSKQSLLYDGASEKRPN